MRHLVNVCSCMMEKHDILHSTFLGTCAHGTHTKNADREYTYKRQRGREREQWKVIFYNARTHSFALVFAIAAPLSVIRISGLNAYTSKKWRRDEETMKDGSSTFLFFSFFPYP